MKTASPTDAPSNALNWAELYRFRRTTQQRYPNIWKLPIKKRHHQVVVEHLDNINSVLELGAGARNLSDILKRHKSDLRYHSFDVDRSQHHDFYTLDDINGEYDAVCMFEVIEHIRPEQAVDTLAAAHRHMRSGALIFVSTPNTFHPPEYLRDATHITPWCYDELGAVLQYTGFELQTLYRLYQDPLLQKLMRRYLMRPLFRLLGIDFSKQIIAVAKKP